MRFWVASNDFTTNLTIGPSIMQPVLAKYQKLRNTLRFLLSHVEPYEAFYEKVEVPLAHHLSCVRTASFEVLWAR